MRESLGVVFENQSISTALVDADTPPLLGSIDEFRHPLGCRRDCSLSASVGARTRLRGRGRHRSSPALESVPPPSSE